MKQRKLHFQHFAFKIKPACFSVQDKFSFVYSLSNEAKENYFLTKDFADLLCHARQRTSICVFFFE